MIMMPNGRLRLPRAAFHETAVAATAAAAAGDL
jgi:hypothetical protein